jgi:hypothetical protein
MAASRRFMREQRYRTFAYLILGFRFTTRWGGVLRCRFGDARDEIAILQGVLSRQPGFAGLRSELVLTRPLDRDDIATPASGTPAAPQLGWPLP